MNTPTSTYRIQFRNDVTFEIAAESVPYLKELGISHLYASPIFSATSGSTHGYDVTNCNEIDSAIGGREGFELLSARLKEAGLGLILDIVPNHMAASTENAWWGDVLKFGRQSAYANYFDIDWSERLTLPILGKPFEDALADGEFELRRERDGDQWRLAYYETLLPLAPGSAETVSDPKDRSQIAAVHDAQHWQLTHWKQAARHLSYRRFFEVTGLVGLRVEDEKVFLDSHRLIVELVRAGNVQGLRLDHIDGLADPAAYLSRLREAVGPHVFIVVEKILGHGERLPQDWPVQGTTGYEFITALSTLLIDADGFDELGSTYAMVCPETSDFPAGLRAAKSLMVERNFEGETARLVQIACTAHPELQEDDVAEAVRELLVAFPVYRTYGNNGPLNERDSAVLETVLSEAARHVSSRTTLESIATLIRTGSHPEFRARFQQLSGPVMAKAVEDTLFYRHNRLLAANEVGGEPNLKPGGIETFHALMRARAQFQPHGLSATSTHDTKRGEDARARLYALSEEPDLWRRGFERWRDMNGRHKLNLNEGPVPERNTEWMLYQALAGIWPEDFRNGAAEELTDRFVNYVEKAVREAKLATSWDEQNFAYEEAVKTYAAALTSSSNRSFHEDFARVLTAIIRTGYMNSLSQTLIKLTAPGIPDIYQGTEGFNFSLVDPDNRRSVDRKELSRRMAEDQPITKLSMPALKQRIIQIGLRLRNRKPELFLKGNYLPLAVTGRRKSHVLAFARERNGDHSITIVPRLMAAWLDLGGQLADPQFWEDTRISLPKGFGGPKRDLLNGKVFERHGELELPMVLAAQPVALIAPAS